MLSFRSQLTKVATVMVLAGSMLGGMGGVASADPGLFMEQELVPDSQPQQEEADPQTGAQWR